MRNNIISHLNKISKIFDKRNKSENYFLIIRNASWLTLDRIIRLGGSALIGVLITRYLGPEKFGILSYTTALPNLFLAFTGLGMDQIAVRELVRNEKPQNSILGTAFSIRGLGGIVSLLIALVSVSIFTGNDQFIFLLVLISSFKFLFLSFDVIDFWFQSQTASKYPIIARNTAFIVVSVLKIFLLFLKAPLIYFVIITAVEFIFASIALVIIYKIKGNKIFEWKFDFTLAKSLLKEGFPLMIAALAASVYYNIDQIVIGNYFSKTEVGFYSAALRLSEIWYFIPVAFYSSVFPLMTKLKDENEKLFFRRFSAIASILFWISFVFAIVMSFSSGFLINIIYGNRFSVSAQILSVHIWSCVFIFVGIAVSIWTMVNGFQYITLISCLTGAVINIILDVVLVPVYKGVGAAYATIIAYSVANYFVYFLIPKSRRIIILVTKSIINPWKYS